jgi:hypothetical protein
MTSLIPLLILSHSLFVQAAESCRFKIPSVKSLVISGLQNFIDETNKQNEKFREDHLRHKKQIEELKKKFEELKKK